MTQLRTRPNARARATSSAGILAVAALAVLAPTAQGSARAAAAVPRPAPSSATTSPVAAARVVTFGVVPSSGGAPDGRTNLSYGGTPGGTLRDHVDVVNFSTRPVRLQLYPTDAVATADGSFSLKLRTALPTDVGAWIRLRGPSTVTVPARTAKGPSYVTLPLTVTIPPGATPGDHVGGVVASLLVGAADRPGPNVRLDQRVGTRVYVRVAGTLRPDLAVTDLHASYDGTADPVARGRSTVDFTVRNTGNVRLGINPFVTVSGLFGSSTSTVPNVPATLLPGGSVRLRTSVPRVAPALLATATVRVTPTAVGGDIDPRLSSVSASTRFWAVPWGLLVVVALLLVGVGLLMFRRRRRRRSVEPRVARHAVSAPSRKASLY